MISKEYRRSAESQGYTHQAKEGDNNPVKVIVRKLIKFIRGGSFMNSENVKESSTFVRKSIKL